MDSEKGLRNYASAKILLDSLINGIRVTTFELYYPRLCHSEFMTHRVFSRSASSSRAIPVERMIREHANYIPANWRENQKGMQPTGFISPTSEAAQVAYDIWTDARDNAIDSARQLMELGVAKEQANRLLEPFIFIKVIVTATDYENFFQLRSHPDAQWEIHQLSDIMMEVYQKSNPRPRKLHLPYVAPIIADFENSEISPSYVLEATKQSVARCARVSYATHEGKQPKLEEDMALYDRLIVSFPPHASPAEHQVMSPDFYDKIRPELEWPVIHRSPLPKIDGGDDFFFLKGVTLSPAGGNFGSKVIQYRKVLEAMRSIGLNNG